MLYIRGIHAVVLVLGLVVLTVALQILFDIKNASNCQDFSKPPLSFLNYLIPGLPIQPSSKSWEVNEGSFSNAINGRPQLRVYMYELPHRFNLGVVEKYWANKKKSKKLERLLRMDNVSYPDHQHMAEWYLYSYLERENELQRYSAAALRVTDPLQADVFFVPFFSSLSMKVDPDPFGQSSRTGGKGNESSLSNSETEHDLILWLSRQEPWKLSGGRDHVFAAQHPNALWDVRRQLQKSIMLVSDFAKSTPMDGSLAKDVVVPYVHRVVPFTGETVGHVRDILLFFVGARHRKEGGTIRDKLFRILEGAPGVHLGEGRQNRQGISAAEDGMRRSVFCLHPAGDTPSGGRLFDAIVSLCIPVVVSDLIELPFEDVLDYTQFAIFVPMKKAAEPGYLVNLLQNETSESKRKAMQAKLREVSAFFQYDPPAGGAIDMIWHKIATKVPAIKEQINRDHRLVPGGLAACRCQCLPDDTRRFL